MLTRTDGNGNMTAVSGYDGLNRPASTAYAIGSGSQTAATPTVTYAYDHDFKGSLWSVTNSNSATSYTHDSFGRVSTSTQTMGTSPYTTTYTFTYGYSLTDALTSMTYPSGRQVTYAVDAADRVTAVTNVSGGGSYATVSYNAPGAITSMTMGNGVVQNFTWNDRVQPTQLAVTHSGSSLLTLGFFPCAGGATSCSSGNNGNLQSQTITLPGLSVTQNYTYDHLNRLTNAAETGGAGWSQNYGYDHPGNRFVNTSTGLPALTLETPSAATSFSTTVQNQVAGWTYDGAGNLLQPGSVARSFSYDAENRQVTANINGSISTYAYDGNGLRVTKSVPAGSATDTTVYVYDAWGNKAAEYPNFVPGSDCGTQTCYVTMDHLGSTRMLTDSAGNVQKRYDYLPFGQEIGAGYASRTAPMGYQTAPDSADPKFTGQDRDPESTLDWFQVRYYSGAQGRFQSPDPGNAGARAADPQSWNMYSYVENNPLSFTDPSGMTTEVPCNSDGANPIDGSSNCAGSDGDGTPCDGTGDCGDDGGDDGSGGRQLYMVAAWATSSWPYDICRVGDLDQ
jgi:RHS repeat-associated protein